MKRIQLGKSDLQVSPLCLGTMTFGEQNTESEGHRQLDMAVDHGINFIDTAELYPVPPRRETRGRTEEIIRTWLEKSGKRDSVIIASKVTGRSLMDWFREEPETRLDRPNIEAAIDGTLRRLGTNTIDLYYLHWPDRKANFFGRRGYTHAPGDEFTGFAELLSILQDLVRAGKIRHVGLSNETPWGLMTALRIAESQNLPRPACIQNPYSLLNRTFEVGLAEPAIRESCPLAPYSPLAMGLLTGKYMGGARPEKARLTRFADRYPRYRNGRAEQAVVAYAALARRYNMSLTRMALAYVISRPFVGSTILGATSEEQLEEDISALSLELPQDLLEEIEEVQETYPNPCP